MNIDTSSKKEQRNFGLVMAAAITVLGLVRWGVHWRHDGARPELPMAFFVVAALFLLLGIFAPRSLKPLFVVWMKFADVLNAIMTRVILTFVFVLFVLPTSAIMKLCGKDTLNCAWDSKVDSYWEEPEEQPEQFERYKNQF